MGAPITPPNYEAMLALAIDETNLTPEAIAKLKTVPPVEFVQLARYFKPGGLYATLAARAPSRGGIDAWTWVENGHSWSEVVGQYQRFFEGEISQ